MKTTKSCILHPLIIVQQYLPPEHSACWPVGHHISALQFSDASLYAYPQNDVFLRSPRLG